MEALKIGIMGTGRIASVLANTMLQMPQVVLMGAASRSLEKAEEFAARFSIERAYGSYEELAKDPDIQLIYIATPHSEHCSNAKLCLENGKHVLCEKAFAANYAQAKEMTDLAEEKNLMITEAMWVRYMPMAKTLKEVLNSGIIGEPMTLTANLCYLVSDKPRLVKPELAGGALLDVGVYTLNFASIVFGDEITDIQSSVIKTDSGVDAQNSITLCYPGGKMAILNSSLQVLSDRMGIIYGTKGYLVVENVNNFESIHVYNTDRELIETHIRPEQISGYEYQIEASGEAIRNGWTECPQMPHKATLDVMKVMDELRRQWGIRYPFEA
ncbi:MULTISPECIES: Gfo/Idh/MocA family protein [Clostridia]|uniref:Oxidoreductase n=1 Tax=Lacrimispora celerecrescens TaxID=29354 RepID=A0A084JQL7_9FIRM|nr:MULTISPECIES: Gfo/Idh/MocA family oxidoreductase [Clostridia]KEZ91251.1 oxidoreductase [Lacrimispora celerecrescens]MBW4846087.1 Gfo/Idh/MocA family oxidoreductase [Lachnospiraceae bacterium]MSS10070.1 Gfo/Idh/MocA family oxidoreductase [Clostridium sp. WB02_MRS01]